MYSAASSCSDASESTPSTSSCWRCSILAISSESCSISPSRRCLKTDAAFWAPSDTSSTAAFCLPLSLAGTSCLPPIATGNCASPSCCCSSMSVTCLLLVQPDADLLGHPVRRTGCQLLESLLHGRVLVEGELHRGGLLQLLERSR